jgi:glyoxylase-like metal-dependent hydrolase (beta-lactamase superfamily II)
MATPVPIDVRHLGTERVIGSYLVETDDGAALFDCGPTSTLETLKAGLHERGIGLGDVGHLLLSHIHLDHAGAAGVIVREHPHVQVHVSGVGAPHLVDPSRLETSARRLYGDAFDALWGELAPVPEANVNVVGERVLGLDCFPSPGHASHHVCYLDAEGTLFAGDAAGVRIAPQQVVLPPTPPPDVDVAAWDATLDEIARRAPARLALVHFGVVDDVAVHLESLRNRLHRWAELVAGGATQEEFETAVRAESGDLDAAYTQAMPLWQSYGGLKRWAEKIRPSPSRASAAG